MDKIWDRKSFKVGGHLPLWRGWKNRMAMENRQKSNAEKNKSLFDIMNNLRYWVMHIMCKLGLMNKKTLSETQLLGRG